MKCLHCELWQTKKADYKFHQDALFDLCNTGKFKKIYPGRTIHFLGGEPTLYAHFPELSRIVKKQGKKVALWTNGFFPNQDIATVLKAIDKVYLFIPSAVQETYLNLTGRDLLAYVLQVLNELIKMKKSVFIVHELLPQTLQELPEIHEISRLKRIPLIIGYDTTQNFSKNSKLYIKRMGTLKRTFLIRKRVTPKTYCRAFPFYTKVNLFNPFAMVKTWPLWLR